MNGYVTDWFRGACGYAKMSVVTLYRVHNRNVDFSPGAALDLICCCAFGAPDGSAGTRSPYPGGEFIGIMPPLFGGSDSRYLGWHEEGWSHFVRVAEETYSLVSARILARST